MLNSDDTYFFLKRALTFLGDTVSQYRIPGNHAINLKKKLLLAVTRRSLS